MELIPAKATAEDPWCAMIACAESSALAVAVPSMNIQVLKSQDIECPTGLHTSAMRYKWTNAIYDLKAIYRCTP